MKGSRKFFTVGCIVGFLLLAGIGIAAILFFATRPPADLASQLPPRSIPIMVVLSSPLNDHHYPINTYIPAQATAIAREPVPSFTLELWVNGALIETQEVQPNSAGRASAQWEWVPASEGDHTLLARARTPQGQISTSNLVRVIVTEPVAGIVQVPAEEGDTLETMAERYQVPVEEMQPASWDEETETWSIAPPSPPPPAPTEEPVGEEPPPPAPAEEPVGEEPPPPAPAEEPVGEEPSPPAPPSPAEEPAVEEPSLADPTIPLVPGQLIWVPILHLPPSSAALYAPPPVPSGPTQPAESVDPSQIGVSWIGRLFAAAAKAAPAAPDLAAEAAGCDVNLYITDQADNEEGFLVYRQSPDGEELQRVAALKPSEGPLPLQFTDPAQQGRVTYVVAAFNAAGEAPSNPASVALDPACSPAKTDGLQLIGEKLILPEKVDLAYFYATTNGKDWERVPPEGFFSPERGDEVDVWEHIDALETPDLASEVELTIEAWGWIADVLRDLGTLQTTTTTKEGEEDTPLDYGGQAFDTDTTLWVCQHGVGCLSETWGKEATDGPGGREAFRSFHWRSVEASKWEGVTWQASLIPFSTEDLTYEGRTNPPGLIMSGQVDGTVAVGEGADGDFWIALDWIEDELPWEALPFDLYVRVIPNHGNTPWGQPSNTVVVHYVPESEEPLFDEQDLPYPDIYDVWIEEFVDERYPDPGLWGCVYVDEDYYFWPMDYDDIGGRVRHSPFDPDCSDPTKPTCQRLDPPLECRFDPNRTECVFHKRLQYSAGTVACPPGWAPPEGKSDFVALLEGGWRAVTTTWDAVVGTVDWVKNKIVEGFVVVLDQVGIDCTGKCQEYTRKLVDYAVTYFTGIPPELPTSDELRAEGIDYAIELAFRKAGVDCAALEDLTDVPGCEQALEAAKEKIAGEMEEAYLQAARAPDRSPACGVSVEAAHALGKEPWCPPGDMKWRLVPEGLYQPAVIRIGVRRKVGIPVQPDENKGRFISIQVKVINHAMADMGMRLPYSGYRGLIRCVGPLEGELFESHALFFPEMAEGEEIFIPLVLEQTDYTLPGYVDSLRKVSSNFWRDYAPGGPKFPAAVQYSRTCLRRGGFLVVRADPVCMDNLTGWARSCGSTAYWTYQDESDICPEFRPLSELGPF